jgi:hypothetical protein
MANPPFISAALTEQLESRAAAQAIPLIRRDPGHGIDRTLPVLVSHVERGIRSDTNLVCPDEIYAIAQSLWLEDQGVEVDLLQEVLGRTLCP